MSSIFELSKEIKEIELDIEEKTIEYKNIIDILTKRKCELKNTLDNLLRGLDADKMDRGSEVIYVNGKLNSKLRKDVLNNAIKELLNNRGQSLKEQYFGIKIYDGFGEQECDCSYGMGPTYGSIVFEIGLLKKYRNRDIDIPDNELEDAIYYLSNISKQHE